LDIKRRRHSVRNNLKKLRINKKLEVRYIAKELGISPSYYYKIEQGIRNPNLYLAKSIAELLESSVDEIFF